MSKRTDQEILEFIVKYLEQFKETATPLNDQQYINFFTSLIEELEDKNSINTVRVDGRPILSHVLYYCNVVDVEILFKYGADPNLKDSDGNNEFQPGEISNYIKILELFLIHGLDPNVKDLHDFTLLDYCSRFDTDEKLKIMLKYGTDPSLENKINQSYLEGMCYAGGESKIEIVLNHLSDDRFNLTFFDKVIKNLQLYVRSPGYTTASRLLQLAKTIKKLENHCANQIGNNSLKTMCLNQIKEEKFSLENLPESFVK